MTISLNAATLRTFSATRDPTSADFVIEVDGVGPMVPEVGNFWSNTVDNRLWQCQGVVPEVSSTWSLKPDLAQGTFVPTLQFGGASTGITYSANGQSGLYTRIGSLIYINIFLQLTSKGQSTGNAIITGLPFPARSGIAAKGMNVTKAFTGIDVGFDDMKARINAGESQIRLVEVSNVVATGLQNVTDALFANNSIMQVDGFYFI